MALNNVEELKNAKSTTISAKDIGLKICNVCRKFFTINDGVNNGQHGWVCDECNHLSDEELERRYPGWQRADKKQEIGLLYTAMKKNPVDYMGWTICQTYSTELPINRRWRYMAIDQQGKHHVLTDCPKQSAEILYNMMHGHSIENYVVGNVKKRRIKWLGGPGGKLKKCIECDNLTRYWQPETNKPLCAVCANRYK